MDKVVYTAIIYFAFYALAKLKTLLSCSCKIEDICLRLMSSTYFTQTLNAITIQSVHKLLLFHEIGLLPPEIL